MSAIANLILSPDFAEGTAWHRKAFRNKDVIIQVGERDDLIYLVEDGELEVTGSVDLEDNRRIRPGIHRLGPGDVFGEFCLFNDQPRTATVSAIADGRLVVIDSQRLQQYMDSHPDRGYQILKEMYCTIVDRLAKSNKRVEHLFAWGLKAHGIDQHL